MLGSMLYDPCSWFEVDIFGPFHMCVQSFPPRGRPNRGYFDLSRHLIEKRSPATKSG
jgi:hypothetical protein